MEAIQWIQPKCDRSNQPCKTLQGACGTRPFQPDCKSGEIFGLLGPNGSGKTTTINCILSLLTYDKGDIKVFGQKMRSNSYDIKREIGVVMQNVAVYDELTVYENIDYFCGLYVSDKSSATNMLRKQWISWT